MLKEITNCCAFKLNSLLGSTNLLSAPNLHNEEFQMTTNNDAFIGFFIIFWTMIYLTYEKCLHLLLRRKSFPLIQRRRLINAVWNCMFCLGSVSYLKFFAPLTSDRSSLWWKMGRLELGLVLYKSFYFHHAGVEIFCNDAWFKGWTDLLFAVLFVNPYQQNTIHFYRRYPAMTNLLFYKAIDTLIVETCRILFSIWQAKFAKLVAKLLFLLHCLNWIYLYILFVPDFILWPEERSNPRIELYLWMWFVSECLNSVWLKLFGCINSNHCVEACLFPPPTQEAIELASIRKRHKKSLENHCDTSRTPKIAANLWRTSLCAIAMKRKIRRLRQAKQDNVDASESDEIR